MKLLKNIISVFLIFIFVALLALHFFMQSTKPVYSGELSLEGLTNEVKVFYDDYGIPHIYASNEEDANFALGYVYAQDRLFQTQFFKLVAAGRLSEFLGSDLIKIDKYMRALGLRKAGIRSAKKFMSGIDKQYKKSFNAYLNGFNTFVRKGNLPIEYTILGIPREELTAGDSYSIINFVAFGFAMSVMQESITSYVHSRFGQNYLDDFYFGEKNPIYLPSSKADTNVIKADLSLKSDILKTMDSLGIKVWDGSNSWVIGSKKSKSGKVILANDTHFAFSQPGAWFEAEISYPGYNFYGLYLPGVPFPIIGHNLDFGWGLTIFPVDNSNYYSEILNKEKTKVKYRNQWVDINVNRETIKVKGQKEVLFDLKETPHGPLINEFDEKMKDMSEKDISLWWLLQKVETPTIEAVYNMSRARSLNEFEQQLSDIDILGIYVMYGDKKDNFGFWGCGKIPYYNKKVNPFVLLNGSNGEMEVDSFYPFKSNPKRLNPESGFVATANNDPVLSGSTYYPGYYLPTNRINIINKALSEKEMWDVEDVKKLQLNQYSGRDFQLKTLICGEIENSPEIKKDEYLKKCFEILNKWNGEYTKDSKAPMIFAKLLYFINKNTMGDELPGLLFEHTSKSYLLFASIQKLYNNVSSPWWDNISTKDRKESRNSIFVKSFIATANTLKEEWGSNTQNWKWENAHQLTIPHPFGQNKLLAGFFNVGPFKMPSCQGCVNKMEYALTNDKIHRITGGPAMRNIIDFADAGKAEGVLPTGQSGNIISPHYKDQSKLFINGIYRKMIFNDPEIVKVNNVLTLIPNK
jgi:penicillin G amidase